MTLKRTRSAKQALIVSHLRSTGTCHPLKELEKTLPSVASIHAMQVKEFIQELVDEGRVHGEKIGSGNWYWCFAGEEQRRREARRAQVQGEVDRVRARWEGVVGEIAARREMITATASDATGEEELREGMVEREKEAEAEAQAEELERAMRRRECLEEDCRRLRGQLQGHSTTRAPSVAMMGRQTQEFRAETQLWTDNLLVLEGYVRRLVGGDREMEQRVLRECYGEAALSELEE